MAENSTSKVNDKNEIDLFEILRRFGTNIKKGSVVLGISFLKSVVFLLRHWLPLGLSIFAGIGLSYFLRATSDSFYTSDLVLRNNIISNDHMINYINRLHNYNMEDNSEALQNALLLTNEQVNNILDISAYWIIDKGKDGIWDYVDYKNSHNIYDTINIRMQALFNIRVKIKEPKELTILRDGIIKYIESDTLFQQRHKVLSRQRQELISRYDYDIKELDSLQKIKYFEETKSRLPKNGGQMVFLQEQKTQLVYGDIYDLYTKKQMLESERDLYKGIVTVFNEFSLPAKRNNGGLYYGKVIIPILFFLTLLILIIKTNFKKLIAIYNKY
jgi:hypothetical protein